MGDRNSVIKYVEAKNRYEIMDLSEGQGIGTFLKITERSAISNDTIIFYGDTSFVQFSIEEIDESDVEEELGLTGSSQ